MLNINSLSLLATLVLSGCGYQGHCNIGEGHGLRTSGGAQTIGVFEMTTADG